MTTSSSLDEVWFETHTGAIYRFPDVTETHLAGLRDQLNMRMETVAISNMSRAALVIPRSILKEVGIAGQCAFWTTPGPQ